MSKRVIVELTVDAGGTPAEAMVAGAERHEELPGLQIDSGYAPVPLGTVPAPPGAGTGAQAVATAEDGGGTGPATVLIRGEIAEEDEAVLAAAPRVVGVWTDAEVAAFSCGCAGGGAVTSGPVGLPTPGSAGPADPAMVAPAEETESRPADVDGLDLLAAMLTGAGVEPAFSLATASPCTPVDCDPTVAKGTIADVARYLGCDRLWAVGVRGQGVVVGVVDTGIDRTRVANVRGGWTPNPTYPPGTDPGGHGSMCATDVLGMAPDAGLYDIGLLKSTGNMTGFLSDAVAGYQWALNHYRADGTPQILSNSWGMYQKAWAPDYATDPLHPFTRKVAEVIDAGMMVTFAAGNCGQVCPSGRCGADNGPGRSIWGANGHPKVITVGAANIRGEWIGYTSQGPAALDPQKPDFCAPSHFKGFTSSDNGTSAANPVCAGVVALLRGHDPSLTQATVKEALATTASTLCGPGWDAQSGHGMINAAAAYDRLFLFATTLRHAAWVHGSSVEAEVPADLAGARRMGFYGLFEGKPGSFNWFHFALPTPVIVSGRRLRLDSVMTRLLTDPDVTVTNVHVYDGEARIQAYDGLALTGARWFDRFDVLNRSVLWGVGVSIGVRFGTQPGPHRIGFISAGGDFID